MIRRLVPPARPAGSGAGPAKGAVKTVLTGVVPLDTLVMDAVGGPGQYVYVAVDHVPKIGKLDLLVWIDSPDSLYLQAGQARCYHPASPSFLDEVEGCPFDRLNFPSFKKWGQPGPGSPGATGEDGGKRCFLGRRRPGAQINQARPVSIEHCWAGAAVNPSRCSSRGKASSLSNPSRNPTCKPAQNKTPKVFRPHTRASQLPICEHSHPIPDGKGMGTLRFLRELRFYREGFTNRVLDFFSLVDLLELACCGQNLNQKHPGRSLLPCALKGQPHLSPGQRPGYNFKHNIKAEGSSTGSPHALHNSFYSRLCASSMA